MSIDPYLTLYAKMTLKWIMDLNAKAKHVEEIMGKSY